MNVCILCMYDSFNGRNAKLLAEENLILIINFLDNGVKCILRLRTRCIQVQN